MEKDLRKAKKICILTSVHPAFDVRIFHKEAKTLVKAGYDVTLIAQHDKNEAVDGIRIVPLPKPKNRVERMTKTAWLLFRLALKQKADVYHFHDPELLFCGVRLKKKTGARLIYDVHENISGQILDKERIPKILRRSFSLFYLVIEKKILRVIDQIILAEDSYLERYKDYKKVNVIKNYPLVSDELLKNEIKLKYGFPKLVYVGGVSKKRGIFEMVKTVKNLKRKFKNIQLKIAGPIERKTKEKVNNLIKSYNLSKNINFYGRIPHARSLQLITEADIGLSILYPTPNYIESLPTKIFEYMVAGLPVVASKFPLWKEIIEGDKCGFSVNPLAPKEIGKTIEYLIDHPEEAKKMGTNGRKTVLEKYNWETESEKLLEVYKNITNAE